jgi:cell wall-associated NlpC family hydrolase
VAPAGHRYFDCSGLVFTAYKQAGVTLGGNWTGAMRSTWPQWADQVPKNTAAMKPGDVILMNGHVVMYIGGGRCVGAQTSHTAFRDQVTTNISAQSYLNQPDAIVLRPRVPPASCSHKTPIDEWPRAARRFASSP